MILNRHFSEKAIMNPYLTLIRYPGIGTVLMYLSFSKISFYIKLGYRLIGIDKLKTINISFFLILSTATFSQSLSGKWSGILFQKGVPDTFYYQINLTQGKENLTGISFSMNKEGETAAKFQIVGTVQENSVFLQEIVQLEPLEEKWCLKNIVLNLSEADILEGFWEAEGCTPGKLKLGRGTHRSHNLIEQWTISNGKWIGHLSQSDRDYGFYYEVEFLEGGTGNSYIVSEGNGGDATHRFNWEFQNSNKQLTFSETAIKEKSIGEWPWCMKSAKLKLTENENKYQLEGEWWGYIEGFSQETGACAPGKLYLEQPKIEIENILKVPEFQGYMENERRNVKVGRAIEVQNSAIKIGVWDNGIVDGDVLSLFLNGKQLLKDFRVTKRKYFLNVHLDKTNNFLILHAEDLGKIMPNTVAVSVDDGVEEQILILSSNLRESGAVLIRQFSIEN